jgi:SAM-dependent methyltransferase
MSATEGERAEMRLEEQIEQIRGDIAAGRFTTATRESTVVIERAFRAIYRQSIGQVDGLTRRKALEAEGRIGGPSKDIDSFGLGQIWHVFRESNLLDAFGAVTQTQLRGIKMIDFDRVIELRNRVAHGTEEPSRAEAQTCLFYVENIVEAFGIWNLEAATAASRTDAMPTEPTTAGQQTRRGKRRASAYSLTEEGEVARLAEQGSLTRSFDIEMFEFALLDIPSPAIGFDVGCATGDVTRDRFGAFDDFDRVIGIDKDAECIRRHVETDERFLFSHLDIEELSAEDKLRTLLAEHVGDRPVVAFLAMVLHHLASPIRVLNLLRCTLPKGSRIIVHTLDDGAIMGFPDDEANLERVLRVADVIKNGTGDRYHGRKLNSQLHRAGLRDIRMFVKPWLLPDLDGSRREAMFRMAFNFRPNMLKRAMDAGDAGREGSELLDTMVEDIGELELNFLQPDYFYMTLSFGAVATVR